MQAVQCVIGTDGPCLPPLLTPFKGWPRQGNVLCLEVTSLGVVSEPWSSESGK